MRKMILLISLILLISSSIYSDGPDAVNLGTAENYVILAKTGVSTTGLTAVTGNIGISPAAASYITGFDLIMDPTGTFSTSSLVTGNIYASDYTSPTPSNLTTTIGDMEIAYADASGRLDPDFTELYAGDLTGQTLIPGLYKWSSGVLISAGGLTIAGAEDDTWIFQISQDLTVADGAIINLIGGAQAANIVWQVAGQTTIGTTVQFQGIILCSTLISLNTGATANGRLLSQTAITLDANSVVPPVPPVEQVFEVPDEFSLDEDNDLTVDFTQYINSNSSILELTAEPSVNLIVDIDSLLVTFTPDPNWNGEEYVSFTLFDGAFYYTDEVLIAVIPVNDAPAIVLPESFAFAEDDMLEVDFASYVTDVDNLDLVLTVAVGSNIIADITGLNVTFTALENWFGNETLTFTIDDQQERLTASDVVDVIVTSVNDLPVADAGEGYSGQENVNGFCEIMLNGSGSYDIDGEIITWQWSWDNGTSEGEQVSVEFPAGTMEVTLTVTDNEGEADTDIVQVIISSYENLSPVAIADEYILNEDMEISDNVMLNDYDPDESPMALIAELITDVSNGTLDFADNGDFTYLPDLNWNGTDSFEYRIFDGESYSEIATVTLIINMVNDAPAIVLPESFAFAEDDMLEVDFAGYVTDLDNLDLVLTVAGGSNIIADIAGLNVTFTALENWFGNETLTFTIDDQQERLTASDVVDVIVTSVNDLPVADAGEGYSGQENVNGFCEIMLNGSGSYDLDGEIVSWHWSCVGGTAEGEQVSVEFPAGTMEVTLTVTDNEGGADNDIVQVIISSYENLSPVAIADEYILNEDMEISDNVMLNDYDPDESPMALIAELITDVSNGTLDFADNGDFTYLPDLNWNGADAFEYRIYDGGSYSETVTASLIVNPVIDGPAKVNLGTSRNLVVLSKTGVSTTGLTDITGNIGVSPAAATYITGFDLIMDPSGTFSTSALVTGNIYAADYTQPTPSNLTTAISDMETAYTDAAGRPDTDYTELYAGDLTGQTLMPGLYNWSSGVLISAGGLTIAGAEEDTWIFQIAQNLTVADGAIITLSGGAQAANIVWQVAGQTTIGTTAQFQGIILCSTQIAMFTGATINGRLLAQTAVTFDGNTVVPPVEPGDPVQQIFELPDEISLNEDSDLTVDFAPYIDSSSSFLELTADPANNIMINIDTLSVTFIPEPDWFGSETITFRVNDNRNRAIAFDQVILNVISVNDMPVITDIIPEQSGWQLYEYDETAIDFSVAAEDIDSNILYQWMVNGEDQITAEDQFSYTFNEDGLFAITVHVTDEEFTVSQTWNFEVQNGPYWEIVTYENSTMAYLEININGLPAETGDIIGAFAGGECRGISEITAEGNAQVEMEIFGNDVEEVEFYIWDDSSNMIILAETTAMTNPGSQIGDPSNYLSVNASNYDTVTQTILFESGWNMTSFNVIAEDPSIEAVFAPIMDNLIKVKDISGSYDPAIPNVFNTLLMIETGNGYYVNVDSAVELEITGEMVHNDFGISLQQGWNLVAYTPQTAQPLEEALFSIWDELLKVKDAYNSFDPYIPSIFNTLTTLIPGNGYWIKVTSEVSLVYNIPIREYQIAAPGNMFWQPVTLTNSAVVYARISGYNEFSAYDEIAAFTQNECRATAKLIIDDGQAYASLVVNCEQSQKITFNIYQEQSKNIFCSEQSITVNPGETYPQIIDLFFDITDQDVPKADMISSAYPNPFNPETTITLNLAKPGDVLLEVYNIRGQKVATLINQHKLPGLYSIIWNAENQSSGMYFIHLKTENVISNMKVILIK